MGMYSKEQIDKAARVDIAGYLSHKGERLVRVGNEYKLIYRDAQGEHDSIFIRESKWYDHKNQIGGNTITFLQHFYDMTFLEAVDDLLNGETPTIDNKQYKNDFIPPKKELKLLPKGKDTKKVFDYLVKQRFLSSEIVLYFVSRGLIYQESRYGNVVFVGLDEHGEPKSACQKSTNNYHFKNTLEDSDKKYGFHHKGTNDRLFVFESAVDLLSYLTLYPKDWKENSYLALDGLGAKAMIHFLDTYVNLDEVHICIDYDAAGIETFDKFKDMLIEKNYSTDKIVREYPICKDWNEVLKANNGETPILPELHPRLELFKKQIQNFNRLNSDTENGYIKWKVQETKELGVEFLIKQMNREADMLSEHLIVSKNKKYLTKQGEAKAVKIADLTLSALCELKAKEQVLPKETLYSETLNELKKEYKPYQDKHGNVRRIDDLKKEMNLVNKAFKNQETSLFLYLKDVAGSSIRLYINNLFVRQELEKSIEVQGENNIKESNAQEKKEDSVCVCEEGERVCQIS